MAVTYTDAEIRALIAEKKPVPATFPKLIAPKVKAGQKERQLSLVGADGNEFVIMTRQTVANPLDFSVIVAVKPKKSNLLFRLRRYNGKSHEHTNKLENQTLAYDFHIHEATERYQSAFGREDSFARRADCYADLGGAVERMIVECGVVLPEGEPTLFP